MERLIQLVLKALGDDAMHQVNDAERLVRFFVPRPDRRPGELRWSTDLLRDGDEIHIEGVATAFRQAARQGSDDFAGEVRMPGGRLTWQRI